jgi:hypothetical protein
LKPRVLIKTKQAPVTKLFKQCPQKNTIHIYNGFNFERTLQTTEINPRAYNTRIRKGRKAAGE